MSGSIPGVDVVCEKSQCSKRREPLTLERSKSQCLQMQGVVQHRGDSELRANSSRPSTQYQHCPCTSPGRGCVAQMSGTAVPQTGVAQITEERSVGGRREVAPRSQKVTASERSVTCCSATGTAATRAADDADRSPEAASASTPPSETRRDEEERAAGERAVDDDAAPL